MPSIRSSRASALGRLLLPSLLAALAAALIAPRASALPPQGGYRTDEHPELGLEFPCPRDYEQVPTQPGEQFVVLEFVEKPGKARTRKERKAQTSPASLIFVWIDMIPDPKPEEIPPTPPGPPAPPGPPGEEEEPEEPRTKARSKDDPGPINSIQRFVEQRLRGWSPTDRPQEEKARGGFGASTLELVHEKNKKRRGFVFSYQNGKRTLALIGFADTTAYEDQQKIWRHVASRLEISEPEAADLEKLKRYYARRKQFRGADYRIQVRSQMVRGWDFEDLENYIVVHHTKDEPLLRQICRDLEAVRKEYVRLFPPVGEIDAVSTVRICRDKAEYVTYGGSPGSAGYWNSAKGELVLYDAVIKERGKRPKDDNTFIVLFHEAFHQYIHYSAGELPPHSWYNEGFADYFSGSYLKNGRVRKIGVNPWRIRTIQKAILEGAHVPWSDIIHYEQRQYYARAGLCYAQGWSMIYFLNTCPKVARRPEWARILTTYFDTLKATYRAELEELLPQGKAHDRDARAEAGMHARKVAVEKAFEGVDLTEIEQAWADYISRIEYD